MTDFQILEVQENVSVKKRMMLILASGIICMLSIGCGTKDYVRETKISIAAEQTTDEDNHGIENTTDADDEKNILDKMYGVIDEIGLENAVDYSEVIGDTFSNQIVFLCGSPSGHYKAYGFITPEYGKQGILIDNIIDHESNYNFFWKTWVNTAEQPTLSESDDFYHVIFTVCQEKNEGMKEISFTTYDTGTMDAEGWNKM